MAERMTAVQAERQRGCWIEGHRGWTGPGIVVHIAKDLGMFLNGDDLLLLSAFFASIERVLLSDGESVDVTDCVTSQGRLADKAEEWLNENIASEGFTFGWHDCEFFLWPDSEWTEE